MSYMHAPTQYYWTLYDQYIENPGFGVLNPLARLGLRLLVGPLRRADYRSAQGPDIVVSNSTYIRDEIKKYYDRDSEVVWPNVDTVTIQRLAEAIDSTSKGDRPFIMYGRQVSWKRADIAIRAAIMTKNKLLVIGDGPEHATLRSIAGDSEYITFMPRYNGIEEIVKHIVASSAYIFPSIEPFGIAPVESLAAGTPVIGLRKGGALDMIEHGVNGLFFDEQTPESLAEAMEEFKERSFDRSVVMNSAEKFSEAAFASKLSQIVDEAKTT